jgi:8-oxo-dGTP pyrophosphatase MutT (NUDIX family)
MGAGILPTTIHDGKLYFLFGKEGKYEDSAPGFSDFGGGTDKNESFFQTAVREACEEFTGFLGDNSDVEKMLKKHGTYNIEYKSDGHSKYTMLIFPYEYNIWLPHYYNNNQRFLQKHLPEEVFKTTKIFEKAEIRWVCIDDLKKMRPEFRSYFQNIVDMIIEEKEQIKTFIEKSNIYVSKKANKKGSKRIINYKSKNQKNKTQKNKYIMKRT